MPYQKEQQQQREYQREWIRKRRAAFFSGKCCAKCGSIDSLQLDHIDPKTKISNRIWSWSAERREQEIQKCQVLCGQCHKTKTAADLHEMFFIPFESLVHGIETAYKRGCRCDLCGAKYKEIRRSKYLRTGT